jgi:hypothetical protein
MYFSLQHSDFNNIFYKPEFNLNYFQEVPQQRAGKTFTKVEGGNMDFFQRKKNNSSEVLYSGRRMARRSR